MDIVRTTAVSITSLHLLLAPSKVNIVQKVAVLDQNLPPSNSFLENCSIKCKSKPVGNFHQTTFFIAVSNANLD